MANSTPSTPPTPSNISVSEAYWSLVDKADKKFCKIRDFPAYERIRYDAYFHKVFKVYTELWKYQQEHRQKLVEAGLKRWEIGEIASRIAQLYFGQYMKTSEFSYLSEAFVFYEAILSREYFKEGLLHDVSIVNKQLRFLARFLMVCLVLNRREMIHQLVTQLQILLDDCKRAFPESDFKEWKLVVHEIIRFLKTDTPFMNIRPLRYSQVLDDCSDSLPNVATSAAKRNLKLRDAILSSYHHNEVKFSELSIDTFRMLQCLEWEPSGTFYKPSGSKIGQNGAQGSSQSIYLQGITDHTLPPNPRKAVLYRPTLTHFLAVIATISEELPANGVLFIYLSAPGRGGQPLPSSSGNGTSSDFSQNFVRNFQSHTINSDGNSSDTLSFSSRQSKGDGCLRFGSRGIEGSNCIYPSDLLPFTRKPLFIVIDSDSSDAFKAINGAEKGEPAAMLLSPTTVAPIIAAIDSSRHSNGSTFTMFLTAPLQTFCLLIGFSMSESDTELYNNAEKLLSPSLNDWGQTLAATDTLDVVWAQILCDPFLRRLLLRFIFCRAVLTLYSPTLNKKEYVPECLPALPVSSLPTSTESQALVHQLASMFGATDNFVFSEGIMLPEYTVYIVQHKSLRNSYLSVEYIIFRVLYGYRVKL